MPEVQFLCVCVESLGVAKMFDRMFNFQHAINCYIPSREYLPRGYGQLGCSGFIISDARGNFVSRKTRAFLQYGEIAFRHVEAILAQQLSISQAAAPQAKKAKHESQPTPKKDTEYLVPSVGVESMDHEHASCAQALRDLKQNPTEANLRKVINELEDHFAHEESLMVQHGFGGDGGAFSALDSHIQDHVRILDIGRVELQRLKGCCATS